MSDTTIRPLKFARVQFDRDGDGCGEWVRDLLRDEIAALGKDLQSAEPEAAKGIREEIVWASNLLRDVETDLAAFTNSRRMRLFRGGQGQWAQGLFRDEQADLYEDLSELRFRGKSEDDPKVVAVRQKLTWSINILRDLDAALISLVGPDEDPR